MRASTLNISLEIYVVMYYFFTLCDLIGPTDATITAIDENPMTYGVLAFQISGPPIVSPPYGSVRAGQYFHGFQTLVRKLGGDCPRILEDNEIDPSVVIDPDFPLPWTAATALLEYCRRKLRDNIFGLHLAEHQGAEVYGCVAALARAAPTLRTGLNSIVDFVPLMHSPSANVELVIGTRATELRWRTSPDFSYYEQANHHGLLLAVRMLKQFAGEEFRPSSASSVCDIHRHRDQIERRLGCPVTGKSPFDSISFPTELLDRPREHANAIVFGLLVGYLSQRKEAPDVFGQVEAYVGATVGSRKCTMAQCAIKLGTSSRTLQKRLASQGTTFSRVLEKERINATKRALLDTNYSLDQIAEYVGYAEKSSLIRAFKRATQLTPRAFCIQARADQSKGLAQLPVFRHA
jgi:AraC-like DNA-binding protein